MSRNGDEWRTPLWLFWCAEQRFGPFGVDLCATRENALCKRYITAEEDALQQDWLGYGCRTGFCNPPYSRPDLFVQRAIDNAKRGFATTMILPMPNGERRDMLIAKAADIVFISGRIAFLNTDGEPVAGNTRGTAIVRYTLRALARPPNVFFEERDAMIAEYMKREAAAPC